MSQKGEQFYSFTQTGQPCKAVPTTAVLRGKVHDTIRLLYPSIIHFCHDEPSEPLWRNPINLSAVKSTALYKDRTTVREHVRVTGNKYLTLPNNATNEMRKTIVISSIIICWWQQQYPFIYWIYMYILVIYISYIRLKTQYNPCP